MKIKSYPLHEKALELSKEFRRVEKDLIHVLQEIEEQKIYLELGFSSMFKYATLSLGLSENNAYSYIGVARKAKEVPFLQKGLDEGTISVSKVKHILTVLEPKNSEEWIEKVKRLSKKQIEKEVAILSPQIKKREKVHYVREQALRMHLEIKEEIYRKLKRAQEVSGAKDLEETLEALVSVYLKTKDPVEKAKRSLKKAALSKPEPLGPMGALKRRQGKRRESLKMESGEKQAARSELSQARARSVRQHDLKSKKTIPGKKVLWRKALSAQLKHEVFLRDRGQCQFRGVDGKVCGEKKFVQIHHLEPLWQGGKNELGNLLTLCHRHHHFFHRMDEKFLDCKAKRFLRRNHDEDVFQKA